jgi:hypothetical protein
MGVLLFVEVKAKIAAWTIASAPTFQKQTLEDDLHAVKHEATFRNWYSTIFERIAVAKTEVNSLAAPEPPWPP